MSLGKIPDKNCNLQTSTNYLTIFCSEFYCFYNIVGLCKIFKKFSADYSLANIYLKSLHSLIPVQN